MNLIVNGIKELRTPQTFFHKLHGVLLEFIAPAIRNDEFYLKLKWNYRMNYPLDLKHPKTFNEKLQWLKLHNRNSEYTKMVDKVEAKKYAASIIGDEYIIPTIAVYDRVEDINLEDLPNQFVLKCTHDSGGIVICKDKSKFDSKTAIQFLSKGLKTNYYYIHREYPYKDVKPRIIAEQYMEDEFRELRDYKFFCFNGEVKALFIASDRTKNEETKFDFFDENFNHLPFTNGHPNSSHPIAKPAGFETMKTLASKLSAGLPHVRIDFYDIKGHVYFGEFTFFHWSGMTKFDPPEWDYKFGSWINLD